MTQKLKLPISVISSFDHRNRRAVPVKILFEGRERLVSQIGFHHTFRDGRVLYHVYSVSAGTLFFRLVLDTETLAWNLEEISDGESN